MKTAIYTISLNEEKHAEAFMKSCEGADKVLVADTGSKDRTAEIVQDLGGTVVPIRVKPWRFDVARNASLAVLEDDFDVCIALDMDELLTGEWRTLLEDNWRPDFHNRLEFRYVHDFKPDGSYGTVGMKNFGHSRFDFVWRHIVHEELYYVGNKREETLSLTEMVIEHRQDTSKSRSSYVPLLEQECQQPGTSPRHMFWLAREYLYTQQWEKMIHWCERFLGQKDTWHVERAHAMRYQAQAYASMGDHAKAMSAYYSSIQAAPGEREMWTGLAWYHAGRNEWEQVYGAITQALSIKHRPEHYLAGQDAWSFKVYDLAAVAAFYVGIPEKAREHIRVAVRMAPDVIEIKQTAQRLGVEI